MNHISLLNRILPDEMRILALDPSSRGLGFALLEGRERLVDSGVKEAVGDKNAQCLRFAAELLERHRPQVLVLEDCKRGSSRRCPRIRKLIDGICELARARRIPVADFSPARVRLAFAPTKDMIAAVIAARFPELAPRLPEPRKLTTSERRGMAVFDAMAFALTFFHSRKGHFDMPGE